jgi:hypothetical protein
MNTNDIHIDPAGNDARDAPFAGRIDADDRGGLTLR